MVHFQVTGVGCIIPGLVANMTKIFENPPDPRSTVQAARNFGKYDLAAALADLIDNSIFARAAIVNITCQWLSGNPEIRVRDDGCGMMREALKGAMRLACKNPAEVRDPSDLGRFGMGMKTASLSQARCLTVVSARNGEICGFRWDIELMTGWQMEELDACEIDKVSDMGKGGESGTEIIWSKIDRLPKDEDKFNRAIIDAEKTISLVFHRFIKPESGNKPLQIFLNDVAVPSIDPFCKHNPATQQLGKEERLEVGNGYIEMATYILPHFSKLADNEYEKLAGEEGYIKNQGFYVYRNRRLIVHGTWFKLARHEDMSRLARVRVDVPNSLDDLWRINLDKTDIQLPPVLRERLQNLIRTIKGTSVKVFRNRGARIKRKSTVSVWQRRATREKIRYEIDLSHPVVEQLLDSVSEDVGQRIRDILSLVVETLPVDTFHTDLTDRHGNVIQAKLDPDGIVSMALNFSRLYRKSHGEKELDDILKTTEPFKENYKILAGYLRKERLLND